MNIGWIGTGIMGSSMAGHLLKAGHRLAVFSRTRSRAEPVLARGARWAESPSAAAKGAEAVCLMVGYPSDVESVVLGGGGALAAMERGAQLIDFTTSSPSLAVKIAAEAAERGLDALDAPVSGGDIGARDATLSIMVGGSPEAFQRALPLFGCLGKKIVHQGPPGAGQHTKMVNQILIAATMVGVCEGLLYARKAGLNPGTVLESVGSGAAASWSLNNLLPRILKDDFQPGFYVDHFIKDLQIALEEAAKRRLTLPGLALARQLYDAVQAGGGGRLGTQALIRALEDLNAEGTGGRSG